jgi:putative SOS response-associated peptidase YedK
MCGRYGRRSDKQYIAEHYKIRDWEDHGLPYPYEFAPSYNISPGTVQPVVRLSHETGEREFALMNWGLIAFWSKTPEPISMNSRDDKLVSSPAWREPWKRRRCLVPVEFFYEWEKVTPSEKKLKITRPWAVTLTDDRLFSFGGIWDRWTDKSTGYTQETFSVVTTEPNELLEPFHNRCPLVIEVKDYGRWLTPYVKEAPSTVPIELVRTYPSEGMKAWRVNPLKGNGPEPLEPMNASRESSSMLF